MATNPIDGDNVLRFPAKAPPISDEMDELDELKDLLDGLGRLSQSVNDDFAIMARHMDELTALRDALLAIVDAQGREGFSDTEAMVRVVRALGATA